MIPDPANIIYCEVCELPHRRGVAVCEECRHFLGTGPNWGQLRAEVSGEGLKALIGVALTIVVGACMVWLGAISPWLVVPPLGWVLLHARRWRAISKRLAKQADPTRIRE